MKKIFTLFLALAASVGSIFAEEVYVNGFRYELNAPTATLINNGSQYSGDVIIPRTIRYNGKEYLVNAIGNAVFYNSTRLTSVIIPNSVVSIGSSVFMNCISLTSVTIPKSVTRIGTGAFIECHSLDSVHIDDIAAWCKINFEETYWSNPLYLGGANLYLNGELVTDVIIPHDIKSIGDYIFYNYSSLRSVTIPNSVKTIGTSAFEGCIRLGTISFGTGLEEIAANAFAGCTRLYDIYVYATYPPFAEESSFANYNVYVYIPCEYQRDYTLDVVWGKFKFIECIDSEEATTDGNVTIVPGYNDVTITWPTEDNADNYAIVIEKDGEVFCTLTFNADGQLLNIAFAPARNGDNRPVQYAEQAVSGYRFTVTGLTEATRYAYNVTTKDAANKIIATYSGEFTTKGGITTAVEDILHSTTNCQKLLRDGQLIIIRDGKTYNVMGKAL